MKSTNRKIRALFFGSSQLMDAFAEHKQCKFIGIADVFEPYLDRAQDKFGKDMMAVSDYRALLDRDDIDVIAIASPDHWHAIQAITAMSAGKESTLKSHWPRRFTKVVRWLMQPRSSTRSSRSVCTVVR